MVTKKSPILAVIVPMKPLHLAKQRLRPALNDEQRRELTLRMFRHVLTTVNRSAAAAMTAVVSADDHVLSLARFFGFTPLREERTGYNEAALTGVAWAQKEGAEAVLILPGDLPLLSPADVQGMAKLAVGPGVVVAPDEQEQGTNALLLPPPNILAPSFGVGSFRRHCQLAADIGIIPVIYRSASLARDIDWPEDLRLTF